MYLCRPNSMADVILLIQDSEIQSSKKKYWKHQDCATKHDLLTVETNATSISKRLDTSYYNYLNIYLN